MCGCSKPTKVRILWDPKQMEVGQEYRRRIGGEDYVAIKDSTGAVTVYREEPSNGPTS